MAESSEVEAHNVAVEVLEELSEDEERERHRLELRVERAFYEAGVALRRLRDTRLYRSTHRTFEKYCRDRFGFTYRHGNQLIAGSLVIENLQMGTNRSQNDNDGHLGTNRSQILPTKLEQVKPLTALEPMEQRQVWQEAVEAAGGKVPNGRIVKGIVSRLKEKPLFKATDFCQVGDVFTLTRLEGPERQYNTCWAIANEVRDFSVVVEVHDGTVTVKPENLNPIDEPDARRQLPQILKRIRRLRECGILDRCAYTVLESLGKQTYLTPMEEKFLRVMEQEYGINDLD